MARDGLYKGLKMNRSWKKAFKYAERESDRGTPLENALADALLKDSKKELTDGCINALLRLGDASMYMLPGFSAHELPEAKNVVSFSQSSPMANSVVDHINILSRQGRRGPELINDALKSALQNQIIRRYSQMEEHCHMERAPKNVLAALSSSFLRVNLSEISTCILEGDSNYKNSNSSRAIDLNEDLVIPQ